MYIVTNVCLGSSFIKDGNLWLLCTGTTQQHVFPGGKRLIVDGFLYADQGLEPPEMEAHWRNGDALERFARFKGRYCGSYIDCDSATVISFTDHLGERDVYLWRDGPRFAVSNDLAGLLGCLKLTKEDLDEETVADFCLFGFPIGERTFVRSLRRQRAGTLVTLNSTTMESQVFWHHTFRNQESFEPEEAVSRLDETFVRAARRIVATQPPDTRYCLGLSGGLDSRIAGHYFKSQGIRMHAYFFGEKDSDEGQIAAMVAEQLGVPLYKLGENHNMSSHFRRCRDFQPFANLEWAKYVTGRRGLPAFDVMLSGFLGEHLFGGRRFHSDAPGQTYTDMANVLIDLFAQEATDPRTMGGIRERIEEILAQSRPDPVIASNVFWYRSAKQYNRTCGLFHHFGSAPHFSLFSDIDVVEFSLGIPVAWLFPRRFYRFFLSRRLPELTESNIRAGDRGNDHKPLERWLRDNERFREDANSLLDEYEQESQDLGWTKELREGVDRIFEGRYSRNQIHGFFRRLTVVSFSGKFLGAAHARG
ncbi:asparagine synthase-related protein [Sorangium sp. So ce1128]